MAETSARSWLRCYRCWSQDLEVQVHYEGIHKIDPDTGERAEVVDELQEAVVQCLDCMHDQPHLGFANGRVEPIDGRALGTDTNLIAGDAPGLASCTVSVDAERCLDDATLDEGSRGQWATAALLRCLRRHTVKNLRELSSSHVALGGQHQHRFPDDVGSARSSSARRSASSTSEGLNTATCPARNTRRGSPATGATGRHPANAAMTITSLARDAGDVTGPPGVPAGESTNEAVSATSGPSLGHTGLIRNLVVASRIGTCTATVARPRRQLMRLPNGNRVVLERQRVVFTQAIRAACVPTPRSPSGSSRSSPVPAADRAKRRLPAITAGLLGRSLRSPISGETHYGAADELINDVRTRDPRTFNPDGAVTVSVSLRLPVRCLGAGSSPSRI